MATCKVHIVQHTNSTHTAHTQPHLYVSADRQGPFAVRTRAHWYFNSCRATDDRSILGECVCVRLYVYCMCDVRIWTFINWYFDILLLIFLQTFYYNRRSNIYSPHYESHYKIYCDRNIYYDRAKKQCGLLIASHWTSNIPWSIKNGAVAGELSSGHFLQINYRSDPRTTRDGIWKSTRSLSHTRSLFRARFFFLCLLPNYSD